MEFLTLYEDMFMLNMDTHGHFTSVPKQFFFFKGVHGKSHFILIIYAKRVHTEHVMSKPFTEGKIYFRAWHTFSGLSVILK